MTPAQIQDIAKAVLALPAVANGNGPGPRSLAATLADVEHTQDVMRAELAAVLAKLDLLLAKLP